MITPRASIFTLLLLCTADFALAQDPTGGGGPKVNQTVFSTEAIAGVTAVTEVFGRSQNVTAVIVEFKEPLAAASIQPASFAVDDRKILSVMVTAEPEPEAAQQDGRFVMIGLDPADEASVVFGAGVDNAPEAIVRQTAPVALASGGTVDPGDTGVINTSVRNLIVDDFRQFRFTDPKTGLILDYNLFIPAGYDQSQSYPLVMFLHDAGVTGSNPRRTLQQGLGAVSFASAQDQAKHAAFVLAPQFPVPLANDASQTSVYVDLIPRLIQQVATDFSIDKDRIHTTGQSGGCMTSIALNVANPDLFAATLCVAGQWDPSVVAPLAKGKFWAIVSEDDAKAFPGMTAIMKTLEDNGATVTRGSIDAKATGEAKAAAVADIRAKGKDSKIFFTTFTPGSVLPEVGADNPGAGHVNTWIYAYDIPAIRDWLLEQSR